MDANILSTILSYNNKYNILTEKANDERSIIVHLAKISYMRQIKLNIYNKQLDYLNKVINDIRKYFGNEKVVVNKYLGNIVNLTDPGCAILSITGYTFTENPIHIKTDMSYNLKKKVVRNIKHWGQL